ncbi:hypothetical protein MBH78_04865 [Oceanimonas sp. NS1]|nr:hypothetical protein [Oceanimonas sp. NS1]
MTTVMLSTMLVLLLLGFPMLMPLLIATLAAFFSTLTCSTPPSSFSRWWAG